MSHSKPENPAALAKEAIARSLAGEPPAALPWEGSCAGLFLSLRDAQGRVRASMGTSRAAGPAGEVLASLAREAATADPRFPPLEAEELPGLSLSLWVLLEPRSFRGPEALRPGDAIRVERPPFSGVFLPENYVGASWEPRSYLKQACRRAGLPALAHEQPGVSLTRFRTRQHRA